MLVIWIHSSLGTGLLMLKTRFLDSAILGNKLLHLISVSDFPRSERGVLVVQIFFLQNNIFIFNLLIDCLHHHTPTTNTTHTTKPHTPDSKITATICYIVFILVIFLWYKTIFSTDPHCVSLYINKEKQKSANAFPVKGHS